MLDHKNITWLLLRLRLTWAALRKAHKPGVSKHAMLI
jgi:hypothetical protein